MRRLLYVIGTLVAGWGVLGLLRTDPVAWARFAITVVIANDGLLLPLVVAAGAALTRARPRPLVQVGLLISGSLVLVALPAVLGYGRSADNPSALPLDYGRGLSTILTGLWVAIITITLIARTRRSNKRDPAEPPHVG